MPGTTRRTIGCILLALGLPMVPAARGGEPDSPAVASTPHFVLHSDFDVNLNDALIEAGTARMKGRPDRFRSGGEGVKEGAGPSPPSASGEASCFDALAPSARAGWSRAVDWYAEVVAPASWNDRQQVLLRFAFAGITGMKGREDPDAQTYVGIARGFLMAAAPAYRACRWEAQDAENRAWIENVVQRLEKYETAIGTRLESLYHLKWHGLPIRVDLVPAALPHGANTWILDPGGHIQIASATRPGEALEVVFHEASHTLMAPWRPDPVPAALGDAAKRVDVPLPRDLWHIVLFYTTGEAVRGVLDAQGEAGYTPLMETGDLWSGSWARYRGPVESTWPAYLSGAVELPDAAESLLRAIAGQEEDPAR